MAEKLTVGGLAGCYANHLKVGQNAFEFLLDFGQSYRADGDEKFYVRIITSPVYAKAFLNVLRECIDHYEQTFGNIPEAHDQLSGETQKPDKGWIA